MRQVNGIINIKVVAIIFEKIGEMPGNLEMEKGDYNNRTD